MQALRPPAPASYARLPADHPPVLLVVVDTEEEFDWNAPFDRGATGVSHMRRVGEFQSLCDALGVRPVYVIDQPIAAQSAAFEPLRAIHDAGRCEIGAHLHPWLSPPFEEELNARNSYPGNLPAALERAKLGALLAAIEENLHVRPTSYKAGRYGFGPHTAATLVEFGFRCDLSFCPAFDQSADGGPDYSDFACEPSWIDERARLLSLPTTGAFVGWGASARSHRLAESLRGLRVPAVLSRLRALERLHLSPEGYSLSENLRLSRALFARGLRVFTLALHSPSLAPGHTEYVRDEAQLQQFLASIRRYIEFFLGELGGCNMTARELHERLSNTPRLPA
ncbi:MAG: polysaccharide deacetylase family protein [Planctomycetes bacterium]|nr:polysaccharide deacetylase family protein [Planctomycetota bacterium]